MGRIATGFRRWLRAIASIITLGLIKRAKKIEENVEIVGMEYDDIVREKKVQAKRIKDAVGGLIAQQEKCIASSERISSEIGELAAERDGYLVLAQDRMEALRKEGKDDTGVIADGEVQQYQAAYADAASTIVEKQKRIEGLEDRAKGHQSSIDEFTIQAQQIARESEKLAAEKHEAMASITANRELNEINEMLAGISVSGTGERLARVREIKANAEGQAKAAARVAGTDHTVQRAKAKAAAKSKVANKDFLKGLGISTTPATPAKTTKPSTEVPKVAKKDKPQLSE